MAEHIGVDNPLRYRGYYYDNETGYYYLRSRYYNPEVGRFINADSTNYIGASGSELSYNLFAYCENNPVNLRDPSGCVALVDDAIVLAFIGLCATAIALYSWMSTPQFQKSWANFCSAVGNGLSSIGSSIYSGGKAAWNWSKAKIKAATAALALYISAVKADAKIKSKVKRNSKQRYWSCTVRSNYVDIGRNLSYGEAVKMVSKGNSIFTVTASEAKAVAKKAYSNKKPVGPEIDKGRKNTVGYYYHYHVNGRKNKAHIFFLFW